MLLDFLLLFLGKRGGFFSLSRRLSSLGLLGSFRGGRLLFLGADTYKVGEEQPSFDKQFVRNWLNANWDRTGNPPRLPEDIIKKTSEKYIQAYEKITGKTFVAQ